MTHSVHVIELSRDVLGKRRFRDKNPLHDPRKPCVYVGMTGKTPKERFQQHKDGVKAARFVYLYGVRLRPRLYERRNPMTYEQAQRMERTIADGLRKRGYAVWQN